MNDKDIIRLQKFLKDKLLNQLKNMLKKNIKVKMSICMEYMFN